MSLIAPNISLRVLESADQTEVYIQDITGDYNAATNPGGWATSGAAGRVNLVPDTTDLSALQILVYDADNTLLNTIDIVLDDAADEWSIENLRNNGITFDATDISGESYVSDGYYQFKYLITPTAVVSGEVYHSINHQGFLAEHKSSVGLLAQYVTWPYYDYNKVNDVNLAWIMLEGAESASNSGNYDKFDDIITKLNALLDEYDISATTIPMYK